MRDLLQGIANFGIGTLDQPPRIRQAGLTTQATRNSTIVPRLGCDRARVRRDDSGFPRESGQSMLPAGLGAFDALAKTVGEELMKSWRAIRKSACLGAFAAMVAFIGSGAHEADAAETLNICHGGHPIMEASIKILEKWAKKFDVNLTSTTVAYAIFVPKITQILT